MVSYSPHNPGAGGGYRPASPVYGQRPQIAHSGSQGGQPGGGGGQYGGGQYGGGQYGGGGGSQYGGGNRQQYIPGKQSGYGTPGAQGGGTPALPGSTPYGAAGEASSTLSEYGQGLMDPGSDLSKRWMEQLREGIGDSADASQRAAGYQAAQQGFGGGSSPELLEMQNAIAQQGLEAQGDAASNFLMQAPQMGIGALSGAMGAQTQARGQDLQSRMAEMQNMMQGQQFNANLGMQQQQLDLQRQDQELRELMALYGGF